MSGPFQVEWVNVSYRNVVGVALLVLLAVGGGGGWWFYTHSYSPRESASRAIQRAQDRYKEAHQGKSDDRVAETLENAEVSLEESLAEFEARDFNAARVAAMRSENLSNKVLQMLGGTESSNHEVHFYRVEGDVRIKRAGEFSWEVAGSDMLLEIGDQVKTGANGSAELLYFDGTKTTVKPGSLLEIRDLYEDPVTKVRRVKEKLTWGSLRTSTRKKSVRGSYHEVATDKIRARAESETEFVVSFDKDQKTSDFAVYDGRIDLVTPNKRETLTAGERIQGTRSGRLQAKQEMPGVPILVTPADQRVFIFEDPKDKSVSLTWEATAQADRHHLQISDKPLFTNVLIDTRQRGTRAVIDDIRPGSFYWKVAAINGSGVSGPFSETRRFRVSTQQIRDRTDGEPPQLSIQEFVSVGSLVIVNGQTEPGAMLWIDNEKIDVYDDGRFHAVVRLHEEGLNELSFVAEDNAGNRTTVAKSAYVEFY